MTMSRGGKLGALAIAACAAIGTAQAADKQDGFFIFLDAAYATPQNTDEVLAVTQDFGGPTQTESTIRTDFGSDFAGRLGFGYQWKGGQSLSIQYWKADIDQRTQADGSATGYMNFAIGPATYYAGYYGYGYVGQFGSPGALDITSKVKAETVDVIWSRDHDLTENFSLKWSLGLRYAKFEENLSGTYYLYTSGYPDYAFGVNKHNKGEMYGFDAGLRVTRDFGKSFSVTSGLAFSFLQGKVESSSGLSIPAGSFFDGLASPTQASDSDNGRSGLIRDFDVGCYWRLAKDHIRLGIGWEQSSWDGVPYDLLRNNVTSYVNVATRNNVTFSSWKVGFKYQF
jgi:hypothetical protein